MYLDIDQNKQSNRRRGIVVQAEALLKGLKSQQARSDRLDTACKQALSLVRNMKPKGKAALIVVHPETKLRELVQIELPFPASVHWRRGAFLRPVVEAMDEHERYCVVLTDNNRARLFTVVMGELTEHDDLFSETGQRTRSLGADQMRSQKRHDQRHQEEIASHAKRVIDAIHDLALRQPFDRLIVGGTPKAAGQLVRLLPTRLRGKLVDTVSMRVGGSQKEILNKILAVQQRMERDREKEIVQGVLAELHDRGKAVSGFAAVLDAARAGSGPWSTARASPPKAASAAAATPTHPTPRAPVSTAARRSILSRSALIASASRCSKWAAGSRSSTVTLGRSWTSRVGLRRCSGTDATRIRNEELGIRNSHPPSP
jgi:hypothetical protein